MKNTYYDSSTVIIYRPTILLSVGDDKQIRTVQLFATKIKLIK